VRPWLALVLTSTILSTPIRAYAAEPGKDLFIYQVQQGRASSLGATLANVFGTGTGADPAARPADAPALILPFATSTPESSPAADPKAAVTPPDRRFSLAGDRLAGAGEITLSADDSRNILAVFATPAEYERLQRALAKLDTPPPQVFIEAAIVEVTLSNDTRYGLQYSFQFGNSNQVVLTPAKTPTVSPAAPGFSFSYANSGADIQVILSALASKTRVEVLSAPKLMVLNGQTATLGAGARVPIATEQAVDTFSVTTLTNKIQYRDTGVVLTVTPRIAYGGTITIDVAEEVSQPTPTTSSRIDSPTIQQRRLTSLVSLQDGQTVALGGLITEQRTRSKAGIPGLQDVPMLGKLFGENGDAIVRTEHVVLLTARIVNAPATADEVRAAVTAVTPAVGPILAKPH
jgi:general secretion pathway protein D